MLNSTTTGKRASGKLMILTAVALALPLTATRAIDYVDVPAPPAPPAAPDALAPTPSTAPQAPAAPIVPATLSTRPLCCTAPPATPAPLAPLAPLRRWLLGGSVASLASGPRALQHRPQHRCDDHDQRPEEEHRHRPRSSRCAGTRQSHEELSPRSPCADRRGPRGGRGQDRQGRDAPRACEGGSRSTR